MKKLMEVKDLTVALSNGTSAVRNIAFDLFENEILGIVGESGSGKTLTVHSLLRLIPKSQAYIKTGSILFEDKDLSLLPEKEMRHVRGKEISIIFQDPFSAFNPTMRIGKQIIESLLMHTKLGRKEAKKEVLKTLHLVGINDPELRYNQYPHELSGGLLQRAMIALALSPPPKILIADEPTTALDVTIQAQILSVLKRLQNISILFITHDLGVVSQFCDRVMVMYAGKIVEMGKMKTILEKPKHPYTKMLLRSHPAYSKHQRLEVIPGSLPPLSSNQNACAFANRCPFAMNICAIKEPQLIKHSRYQQSACFLNDKEKKNVKSKKPEEALSRP